MLERFDVELIGASIDAIRAGEDREEFRRSWSARAPRSHARSSLIRWRNATRRRPSSAIRLSFAPPSPWVVWARVRHARGPGSRIGAKELADSITTEVLLESQSSVGRVRTRVMRDKADNVVVVCSIENVGPSECTRAIRSRLRPR